MPLNDKTMDARWQGVIRPTGDLSGNTQRPACRLRDLFDLRGAPRVQAREEADFVPAAERILGHEMLVREPDRVLAGVFQCEAALAEVG